MRLTPPPRHLASEAEPTSRPQRAGEDHLRRLKVLALTTYPVEAAATRFRLTQFVGPLAERGIDLDVRPFLGSALFHALYRRGSSARVAAGLAGAALRRLRDVTSAPAADVVMVQREAMLLGPPVVEYLVSRVLNRPMLLDLDDATYLRYDSPTYGRLTRAFKWFGKTDDLIHWSRLVTCGNGAIAAYVRDKGRPAVVIPTVVDTDRFRPAPDAPRAEPPLLGWVGSHSTFPYLEAVFPVLERLARTHPFRLRVVGSGRDGVRVPGVEVECRAWDLARECDDFRSLDVGLYPITRDAWSAGKSGFKAIQYMAVGVPYVASPVGACAEIGEPGVTHLTAHTPEQWYDALAALLSDRALARHMGEAGRRHCLGHYTVTAQADKLAEAIRVAAGRP